MYTLSSNTISMMQVMAFNTPAIRRALNIEMMNPDVKPKLTGMLGMAPLSAKDAKAAMKQAQLEIDMKKQAKLAQKRSAQREAKNKKLISGKAN
jgi:hypothetical protein